jgi:DNA polymerase III gamma/tau subunit
MLSRGAFNALLKTLEEPPSHVKFILATTETEKVPATILSRCQRYDFRNIPTREIAGHLKQICKDEKVKAEEDALLLIAKAGAGSMRDALSLLDRLLSLGEKSLTTEMIEQLLGMPKAQVIFDLSNHIGAGDVKNTLESTDKLIRDGLSAESLVAALADHFRNLLLLATCGKDSELVEVAGLALDELFDQARRFDAVALSQSIAVLEDLRRNLRTTSAGRALLDATLVRLALAEQFTKIEDLLAGNGASATAVQKKKFEIVTPPAEGEVAASPATNEADDALPAVGKVFEGPSRSLSSIFASSRRDQPQTESAARLESNVETVDQGEFAPVMKQLRAALAKHSPGYEGILVHGQIVSVANGQATIRYSHAHEASARMLQRNGKRETVQQVLSELLKESVGVQIEVEEEPVAEEPAATAPAARPQSRIQKRMIEEPPPMPQPPPITAEQKQKILESDPFVRAACEMFNGEIVKAD